MGQLYLLLTLLAWGFWAVAAKKSADLTTISWVYLIGLAVTIPVDLYYAWGIRGTPTPNKETIMWILLATAFGVAGNILYFHSQRFYPGSIVAAVTALYPVVTTLIFFVMGTYPTIKQWVGILLAVVAAVLLS